VKAASPEQISKLLTCIFRSERFVEGALKAAFDRGIITAICQRAEALLQDA
jgi:hypothetical protein